MITVSGFAWVPEFARGHVKDLRVRWALEEAGLQYRMRLLGEGETDGAAYRAVQPFGQVPVFEEDGLTLFESGAIVLHVGERSEVLLPREAGARARAVQWVFAALNSIEPHTSAFALVDVFYAGEAWAPLRRPSLEALARRRVGQLAAALGDKPFLDGDAFTVGDLMMATVLRGLGGSPVLTEHGSLVAYLERCTGRAAFCRALEGQLGDYSRAA